MPAQPRSTTTAAVLDAFGDWLSLACRLSAAAGGLLLLGLALMTVISVLGRYGFSAPIPGDFEVVEVGCAVAVFLFLPYCQITRGNVIVDFFTARVPARRNHWLDAAGSLIYALIAGLLTWRMILGGLDMHTYEEQTMILGMARWWGFIPIVFATALLTLVCLYTLLGSLKAARR